MNTNFSTLGVGVDFNENDNHIGQKIIRAKCFNDLLRVSFVDKEVDIMTTKDVNKLDILDKVKEILNKKKIKQRTASLHCRLC